MNVVTRVGAFVGIGSNLDHPTRQVEAAIDRLGELPSTTLLAASDMYRSSPLGGIEQPDYVNAVAHIETALTARQLLESLLETEKSQGRLRDGRRWGPRVIDLDLLVYGEETIAEPGLQVPHPGIAERNFVLLPLLEIAPDLVVPGLGLLSELVVNCEEPRIERMARV